VSLPENLYKKLYQKAEALRPTQLLLVVALVAILGLLGGLFFGRELRGGGNSLKIAPQLDKSPEDAIIRPEIKVETITGKIFPVEKQISPNSYSHMLVDDSGKTVAYLLTKDDKLKIVISGTVVTASGTVWEHENYIPIMTVDELKF